MPPTFSIVIPVYNEAEFLPRAIPALIAELETLDTEWQMLIVENGSTDGTAEKARQLGTGHPIRVESLPVPDYGAAMRHGFETAEGEWVVNFDIDYFSASFLDQVVGTGEADLVIGSKRDPGSDDRRPVLRRVATRVFNVLLSTLLGSGVSDTHGMKAFRSDLVAKMVPQVRSNQDLFDTELVVRAERAGYRIVEVPVVVEEIRMAKSSLLKRVPRTLTGLWRIRKTLQAESNSPGAD